MCRADGRVGRTFKVATEKQLSTFHFLYTAFKRYQKKDAHRWNSVFFLPYQTNFNRAQRLACCFSCVFLALLVATIMYDYVNDGVVMIELGMIRLTLHELWMSMIGLILALPIMELFCFMFKSVQPTLGKVEEIIDQHVRYLKENTDLMMTSPSLDVSHTRKDPVSRPTTPGALSDPELFPQPTQLSLKLSSGMKYTMTIPVSDNMSNSDSGLGRTSLQDSNAEELARLAQLVEQQGADMDPELLEHILSMFGDNDEHKDHEDDCDILMNSATKFIPENKEDKITKPWSGMTCEEVWSKICVIVGWTLVTITILFAAMFIIFFSNEWSIEKSCTWLIIVFLVCAYSYLVVEPLKVCS